MNKASITIMITERGPGDADIEHFVVNLSNEAAAGICRQVAIQLDRAWIRAELEAERGENESRTDDVDG